MPFSSPKWSVDRDDWGDVPDDIRDQTGFTGDNMLRDPGGSGTGPTVQDVSQRFDSDGDITQEINLSATAYVSDAEVVDIGTRASPGAVRTKTIRIPAAELIARASEVDDWTFGSAAISPFTIGSEQQYEGALFFPKGVTLTKVTMNAHRAATADSASLTLFRISDTNSPTILTSLSHSSTGWQQVSSTLSETVGNDLYSFRVSLTSDNQSLDARFLWVEIEYDRPDYDTVY